jgi:hypothetical protein
MRAADTVDVCFSLVNDGYKDITETVDIDPPPPEHVFGLKPTHTFGEALTAIINSAVEDGLLLPPPHYAVMRLEVSVERPWPTARIRVWGSRHLYTAVYILPAQKMKLEEPTAEADLQKLRELDAKFEGNPNFYRTQRTVGIEVFYKLGDCLRDQSDA